MGLRTKLEGLVGLIFIGLLVWQVLTAQKLRTQLANQRVATRTAQLSVQAAEFSHRSCQAALGSVQAATVALGQATQSAYATADRVHRQGSERLSQVRQGTQRLLTVRAPADRDCETATGLAQAAWFEGQ